MVVVVVEDSLQSTPAFVSVVVEMVMVVEEVEVMKVLV